MRRSVRSDREVIAARGPPEDVIFHYDRGIGWQFGPGPQLLGQSFSFYADRASAISSKGIFMWKGSTAASSAS